MRKGNAFHFKAGGKDQSQHRYNLALTAEEAAMLEDLYTDGPFPSKRAVLAHGLTLVKQEMEAKREDRTDK